MKKTTVSFLAAAMLTMVGMAGTATATFDAWEFEAAIPTPEVSEANVTNIIRLHRSANGTVYLSNSSGSNMTIYKSTDITADPVVWEVLVTNNAMANGFQGITSDADNNVYIAGESGTAGTGVLYKFDASGDPVTAFGTNGVATPTGRLTGIDILPNGTILATNFSGQFFTFDGTTGAEATSGDSGSGNFLRDISLGADDVIYGNRSGSAVAITGGTFADPSGYNTTTVLSAQADASFQVRSAGGYSASDNTYIFGNWADHRLRVVDVTDGTILQTIGTGSPASAVDSDAATEVYYRPGDNVTWEVNGTEYLLFCLEGPFIALYSRSDETSIQDWSLFN